MENKQREEVYLDDLDRDYFGDQPTDRHDNAYTYLAREGGLHDINGKRDWLIVEEEVTDYDLSKGYEEREGIFQRMSDNKFFKWKWMESQYVDIRDHCDNKMVEVFPRSMTKTVTIITYE